MSQLDESKITSDITVYGATGIVGNYICRYLVEAADVNEQPLRIVLAGRNEAKLRQRVESLPSSKHCTLEIFVADADNLTGLIQMVEQTKVVIACAGPFSKYGTNVVAACATTGTDYLDITAEFIWVAQMRQKFGEIAKQSGARIVSFCGFDSVPSDLSVYGAVEALREVRGENIEIERASTWHYPMGGVNAGTVHTALSIPIDIMHMVFDSKGSMRRVPFLVDDPLCMTHPTQVRHNPDYDKQRNSMALTEWLNNMPSFDGILATGMSLGFFMAVANSKVVYASAVSLKYGKTFQYYERWVPIGFTATRSLGIFSAIPALVVLCTMALVSIVLKLPCLGQKIVDILYPPGLGTPDSVNKMGFAEVYAEVVANAASPTSKGNVDRAACRITFQGDPGNLVTAQCICESALALLYDRQELPERSEDGFGTPAEIIGTVLLQRLRQTRVRVVQVETKAQKNMPKINLKPLV